jgi:hypothetical protein
MTKNSSSSRPVQVVQSQEIILGLRYSYYKNVFTELLLLTDPGDRTAYGSAAFRLLGLRVRILLGA